MANKLAWRVKLSDGWTNFCGRPYLNLGLVAVVSLMVFVYLQPAAKFADPDSFYHTWLTVTMRDSGLVRDFPWTQASLYQDIFIDHHFGYHLLLIPFVSLWPDLKGLQVATVVFASLTMLACAWLLRRWRVPWWGLGVLLLLTAGPLLFRLSLGKAPSLGVGVAVIGYYLITERKLGWLFWWSWFFTWLYSAWPLLIVMAAVYLLVDSLTNPTAVAGSGNETGGLSSLLHGHIKPWLHYLFNHDNFYLVGVILLGYLAGLIINPYFPTNLLYLQQLFTMALVAYRKFIGIGSEWYPYSPTELAANLAYPILIWLLASLVAVATRKQQTSLSRTTWLLAVIFLLYTLRARRQVEYLAPWLVLSSGLIVRDAWNRVVSLKQLWQDFVAWLPSWLSGRFVLGFLSLYLAVLVPWGLARGVQSARAGLNQGLAFSKLQSASQWLKDNTEARAIVFQNDWGTFPVLLYHNSHNYYLTGLDQTFMYEYDRASYWQWVEATQGKTPAVCQLAKHKFQASYLLLDKTYPAMLYQINRDAGCRRVYEDSQAVIFSLP
jgi:hypothetical protein